MLNKLKDILTFDDKSTALHNYNNIWENRFIYEIFLNLITLSIIFFYYLFFDFLSAILFILFVKWYYTLTF